MTVAKKPYAHPLATLPRRFHCKSRGKPIRSGYGVLMPSGVVAIDWIDFRCANGWRWGSSTPYATQAAAEHDWTIKEWIDR